MMENNNVIAVVDIGSTKVCAIIGRVYPEGKLKVEGEGSVSCRGFKKMAYSDLDMITTSIKRALVMAQEKANIIVSSVYVNIRGIYLNYILENFSIDFGGREKEIDGEDILKLIKQASKIPVYEDETIVDVVPIKFYIDGDTEVAEPVGLEGKMISADINIILGHAQAVKTICSCVQKLGLIVDGIIPEAYPIAFSQLRTPERHGTTLIIDVGGKITEYTVLKNNVVVLNSCIPCGGDNITSDIAKGLDVSNADAETLKRDIGYAAQEAFRQNRDCYVTHVGTGDTEMIRASHVIDIIEARASNIIDRVKDSLEKNGVETETIERAVIVGEGLRSMEGVDIIVKKAFGIDSRRPDFFVETGYMPTYLTAYSILTYIYSCIEYGRSYSVSNIKVTESHVGIGSESKGFKKYISMLKEFFTLNE